MPAAAQWPEFLARNKHNDEKFSVATYSPPSSKLMGQINPEHQDKTNINTSRNHTLSLTHTPTHTPPPPEEEEEEQQKYDNSNEKRKVVQTVQDPHLRKLLVCKMRKSCLNRFQTKRRRKAPETQPNCVAVTRRTLRWNLLAMSPISCCFLFHTCREKPRNVSPWNASILVLLITTRSPRHLNVTFGEL